MNAIEEDIASNPVSAQRAEFRTAIVVTQIVSAIGWLTSVVAVIAVSGAFAKAGRMGALALAPAWGVFIGGLVLVIAGQTSRAVLHTENVIRKILQEVRKSA